MPGAILLATGLLALVVPLIEGRERGWPGWCLTLLAASLPLLWAFWNHEKRTSRSAWARARRLSAWGWRCWAC
ncbi:MAG: hypothetical protein QM766_22765 [Burkholderiaceae bacterium]